jgi:hypothetical protein
MCLIRLLVENRPRRVSLEPHALVSNLGCLNVSQLLFYPFVTCVRHRLHDLSQASLVGGHQQPCQCPLKRAGGLDSTQGLDGADEGLALGYDTVGKIGDGHLKIPATRFGSGAGVGDRPAAHNLGAHDSLFV